MKIFTPMVRTATLTLALAVGVMALAGCAVKPPLLVQLEQEKITTMTLVVERETPRYTVPAYLESARISGGLASALLGGFAGFSDNYLLDKAHDALNQAAASQGLNSAQRQRFVAGFVERLREKGIAVAVVPATYEKGTLGGSRYFFKPTLQEVKALPTDKPSLYLNLDLGTATVGTITPSILATINSTGVVSAPGPQQKYRGASVGLPVPRSGPFPEGMTTFPGLEAATARIVEFDAALDRLIPVALDRLMAQLQQQAVPK